MSADTDADGAAVVNKNKRYRRDKPWDTDDIDHWAIEPVTADNPLPPPVDESVFATLFPKYRETYLRQVWPLVTKVLAAHGIATALDLVEGSMSVRTTRKTFDPSIILKARDMIKLLARSLPLHQAQRVLSDGIYSDIIKIKNLVGHKERYIKRRQRLIGPNGATLKAIELLTEAYMFVQGNTVSVIGSIKALKVVRRIVEECMHNIHPIYNIKLLMIKKELENDEKLKNENWDRFLPKFHKTNIQRKKKTIINIKKPFTPFPPAQQPRKMDLAMETGEYWLGEEAKINATNELKKQKREEKAAEKKKNKLAKYQPQTITTTTTSSTDDTTSHAAAEASTSQEASETRPDGKFLKRRGGKKRKADVVPSSTEAPAAKASASTSGDSLLNLKAKLARATAAVSSNAPETPTNAYLQGSRNKIKPQTSSDDNTNTNNTNNNNNNNQTEDHEQTSRKRKKLKNV